MRILAFITILMAILVTDPGDAPDYPNDQLCQTPLFAPPCRPTKRVGALFYYMAILPIVEQPGMVGTPKRLKQLYGRVLPIHLGRAGLRADSYLD